MPDLISPESPFLAFLFFKRFVFIEVLLLLALLRAALAEGPSRIAAALTAGLSALAVLTIFAPVLGLSGAGVYPAAAQVMNSGAGLRVPLALSALFFLSAVLPARQRRAIDLAHLVLFAALLWLWRQSLA